MLKISLDDLVVSEAPIGNSARCAYHPGDGPVGAAGLRRHDPRPARPRPHRHHIALYVDDIEKAAAYLKSKNVKTLQGPIPINDGPAAGQSILYFFAPWGLQMELISYPKGMAYQKDAKSVLWMTTEPGK